MEIKTIALIVILFLCVQCAVVIFVAKINKNFFEGIDAKNYLKAIKRLESSNPKSTRIIKCCCLLSSLELIFFVIYKFQVEKCLQK